MEPKAQSGVKGGQGRWAIRYLASRAGRRLTAWLCGRGLHVRRGLMTFKDGEVVTSVATRCLGCNLFLGMKYMALILGLAFGVAGCTTLPAISVGATLGRDAEWVLDEAEGWRRADRYSSSFDLYVGWEAIDLSTSWSTMNQDCSVSVKVPLFSPSKGE